MSDTNEIVLSLNMASCLKFRIQKEEGLYYTCSIFTYTKIRFSHDVAHV